MGAHTKRDLVKMWKRPPERQYNIATAKILEAILATKGDITICFSGGKDSSLLLDMYCEVLKTTEYANQPVKVCFANTTNETSAMLSFVSKFIPFIESKHRVKLEFEEVSPPRGLVWASFIMENGIPLISKMQSKAIRTVKQDMRTTGCDYETVLRLASADMKSVNELFGIGFSKTGVLALTGYISYKETFGKSFMLSRKWLPMVKCEVDLTEQCCIKIKESALKLIDGKNMMTGEQASESANREAAYLKTGCNIQLPSGEYKSKPFGAMTLDGILFGLQYRQTPICGDYGDIVITDGHYRCTKAQRTGCALCGFGCQYDTHRFVRLQETEPAKVKFAFKPLDKGGAGYKEAIEYMNEHCGTRVVIPKIDN